MCSLDFDVKNTEFNGLIDIVYECISFNEGGDNLEKYPLNCSSLKTVVRKQLSS